MAISESPNVQGTLSLDEFIQFCKSNVNYEVEDSIMKVAEPLAALANDRRLLIDAVNSVMYRKIEDSGNVMGLSTQSLLLYADSVFKVRANIWKKPEKRAGTTLHDSIIYSYDFAHNHNFQLLTVGYFGPGYWTEIHECNPLEIVGYVGEAVALRYLERTSLPRGKVMLYRAQKDVHTQLPPDDFSISLNLLIADPTGYVADQYSFDVEQARIASLVIGPMASRIAFLGFAATLGSPENFDAAIALARKKDVHWRARLSAYECGTCLAKEQMRSIWLEAAADSHPKIREAAVSYLAPFYSTQVLSFAHPARAPE